MRKTSSVRKKCIKKIIALSFAHFSDEKNKINESIEKMTEGIEWAKIALLEWRQVMLSSDEANKMIEKLCRMDAGKAEVNV